MFDRDYELILPEGIGEALPERDLAPELLFVYFSAEMEELYASDGYLAVKWNAVGELPDFDVAIPKTVTNWASQRIGLDMEEGILWAQAADYESFTVTGLPKDLDDSMSNVLSRMEAIFNAGGEGCEPATGEPVINGELLEVIIGIMGNVVVERIGGGSFRAKPWEKKTLNGKDAEMEAVLAPAYKQ